MTPTNTDWTDTIIIQPEYHAIVPPRARVILQIKLDITDPHISVIINEYYVARVFLDNNKYYIILHIYINLY